MNIMIVPGLSSLDDFSQRKNKLYELFSGIGMQCELMHNGLFQLHSPSDKLIPVAEGRFVAEKLKSEIH